MRLMVAVPSYGLWQPDFGASLALMMADLASHPDVMSLRLSRCEATIIAAGRTDLVKDALAHNADRILWLDTDMKFKPSNVRTLLTRDADIVAVDYPKRLPPHLRTANDMNGETIPLGGADLVEAQHVGLGLALIKTEVFRKLPQPWFAFPWLEETGEFMGEDVWFCRHARAHGFKVHVDPLASVGIGHVGTHVHEVAA